MTKALDQYFAFSLASVIFRVLFNFRCQSKLILFSLETMVTLFSGLIPQMTVRFHPIDHNVILVT